MKHLATEGVSTAMRAPWLLVATCLTAGCYTYAPLTTPTPAPGAFLAATLTDSGSTAMARYLGPDVMRVRGRYLSSDDSGLQLSVTAVELKRGDEIFWKGESVVVPAPCIASLEVRQLAKGKSYLLAGASAAGLVITTGLFTLTGRGSASPGGGRPPPR